MNYDFKPVKEIILITLNHNSDILKAIGRETKQRKTVYAFFGVGVIINFLKIIKLCSCSIGTICL